MALAGLAPIAAAQLLPGAWLAPAWALAGGLAWFALRPRLRRAEGALRRLVDDDRGRMALLLAAALAQGLAFVALLPPWQHYDEPAHFEFAWLIANHQGWPAPGTSDPRIAPIGGEGRGLHHPPLYHLLVSLPLRLAGGLDLIGQLYVARLVSLGLFLLTIAIAALLVRDLTPPRHPLRWAAPLGLLLLPTFADIMTAVNNDVGAIAVGAIGLWGGVRSIRFGLTPWRAAWLLGATLAGVATKNTAAPLVVLAPLAALMAVGRRRRWPWPKVALAAPLLGLALLPLLLTGGEPAAWYRWGASSRAAAVRAELPNAPAGPGALQVEGVAEPNFEGLSAPVLPGDVRRLAGRRITVGAWVWASRPAQIWAPGVIYNDGTGPLSSASPTITVTTEPTFAAWTWEVPERVSSLQLMVWAVAPGDSAPLTIYYDGAVLAEGEFSAAPPQLDDWGARGGVWDGRRFTNLIRNGGAEQTWPRVRPEIEQATYYYIRRSPAQIVSSLLDVERTGQILLGEVVPWVIYAFFGIYAWSQVVLRAPAWQYLFPLLAIAALAGCARAVLRPSPYRAALIFLGIAGALVWGNVVLRVLPALETSPPPFPRYGFPAVIPAILALAGGWLALWPPRLRDHAAALFVAGMALLNLTAIRTIAVFFGGSCRAAPEPCGFTPAPPLTQQPLIALTLLALALLALYRGLVASRRADLPRPRA